MMTRSEAIDLFRGNDLIGLGMAADQVRRKLHPDGIVSYIIDRNINYTNFCTEYCSFCAPEIVNIAHVSGLSLYDTLSRLRDAGLDSVPGGGAEILDEDVRHRISRLKC